MSHGVETNRHTISNKFKIYYFTTIAQNLVSKIKTTTKFCQYLDPQVQNSLILSPTTKEEIEKQIISLSSKNLSDINGICIWYLSENIRIIYFRNFIHSILRKGFHKKFPQIEWNLVWSRPFIKVPNWIWQTTGQYQFYIPIFNKILEKHMLTRLTEFCDKNNIIYNHQFVFKKHINHTDSSWYIYKSCRCIR